MGIPLKQIATEVAHRWISANARRMRKGLHAVAVNVEDLRDFADGIASSWIDDVDAMQLDMITDIAIKMVRESEAHSNPYQTGRTPDASARR